MATSAVEDYLKAILLEEQRSPGARVPMGQVGAALRVVPGTVTAMVKALSDSGLVDYEPYSGVHLTAAGRQLATHVLRRHRLLELFLVRVVGMDWTSVHAEAERLEHAVSEELIEHIDRMLGYPAADPHGDPIPTAGGVTPGTDLPTLLEAPPATPLRVARVLDQSGDFLRFLERHGLIPGTPLEIAERDAEADTVAIRLGRSEPFSLGSRAASKVLVEYAPTS
jgi:DtxR family Mn-dependent transcriptional regulator